MTLLTLDNLYQDRTLYSSETMFSPPAERLEHVIRYELTTGCNWNKCTYCNGYDGIASRTKSIDEYRTHVDTIWQKIYNNGPLLQKLNRVFIGGGNALEADEETLKRAIIHTGYFFKFFTHKYAKRLSLYSTTNTINQKKYEGLKNLNNVTKDYFKNFLIYWGVESGSTEVLRYIHKGSTQKTILHAASQIRNAFVDTSVMIMPGLGGIKYYDSHIKETATVLGQIEPDFLTFMGINPTPTSQYTTIMNQEVREGKNRPLTNKELAEQMIEIIQEMPNFHTKIGCFSPNIDQVGHNPLTFNSIQFQGPNDYLSKEQLVNYLKLKMKMIPSKNPNPSFC